MMAPSKQTVWLAITSSFLLLALFIHRKTSLPTYQYVCLYTALTLSNLFVCWAYHAWIFPHFISPLRTVPTPKGWNRWIGYAFQDIGKKKIQGTSLRTWVNELSGADVIRFQDLFQTEKLLPVSPKALTDVLTTKCYDFEKPRYFKTGTTVAVLGNGLLFAEGGVHKMQRKQLNPAFSFRNIKNLYPKYWRGSMGLVNHIERQVNKETGVAVVEPNVLASRATLDILGEAGFGKSFDAVERPDNPTTKAYEGLFGPTKTSDIVFSIAEIIIPSWIILSLPHPRNWNLKKNTQTIRNVCSTLIEERKEKIEKQGSLPATDILSLILSQKEVTFSTAEMVEQLATFLVAGHETTAAGVAWAIFVFCKYPAEQKRLRDEVRTHIPASAWEEGSGAVVTPEQLEACAYLQAFCAEILRFYPPVPATVREAVVDTCIAGQPVPKGTQIILAPWAVNVAKATWGDDATEWRPERWLETPSGGGSKSTYANLTFIHGPRSCIGMGFAKAEFACLVASWVGRFESSFHKDEGWEEPKVDMMSGIAARPSAGWKVDVKVV